MARSSSPEEPPEVRAKRSPMSNMTREVEKPHPVVELDEIDRRILFLLSDDPRVSQRQLARAVGMSPPAVGERIARLERQQVIRGYTTVVDWSALGYPGLVYIPMTLATDADLGEILTELRSISELTELVVVTGSFDMIARFRIRDHAHLQALLLDRIWPIRGLQRIETFLSLGEVIRERAVRELLEGSVDDAADDVEDHSGDDAA
ncbi:Lrp/AsnC family transcriptional regulator for asnA, asnC and gidA [Microbacterium sp. SLBN-154]|uniref:Lrp/AsnC family transcriptional regulator n=2 Tax=unclassified Microbacterium TaxID=2609290 RepID=UPI0011670568|nr:Lrp/AsnC family transcriptional regulator [Microbacterium sp. SLBN-154]TQK20421.1 Lrp/AsnC family transcriptional regulator for asnA, asnC and gidA [Microbacterium sp. SLBN-154]